MADTNWVGYCVWIGIDYSFKIDEMDKITYEMTQDEFDEIMSISTDSIPVMKFGNYWSGMDKFERANAFWKILADKYGFIWDSSESANAGNSKQFLATPKP